MVGFYFALRTVPSVARVGHSSLDWSGLGLTVGAIAGVAGGIESVTFGHVNWLVVLSGVLGGGCLAVVAVLHLETSGHPFLRLDVFKVPTFRVTNLGGSFFRMAVSAAPFLLPLLFQEVRGWDPLRASLVVVPLAIGTKVN